MAALSGREGELLEHLGLEKGEPAPRLFEDLFLRFLARVPYETIFPHGGPDPAELIASVLENGTGLAGSERTRVLYALGKWLGFEVRLVSGLKRGEEGAPAPHAALVVRLEGRDVLADPALPVPVLLPLDTKEPGIPSALGRLSVRIEAREARVFVLARGLRHEALRLDLSADEAAAVALLAEPPEGPPRLARVLDDRTLLWRAGKLLVADPWSRLEHALCNPDALEALFGLSVEGAVIDRVERACEPKLSVFDSAARPAPELLERLRTPPAFLRLLPPGCEATRIATENAGWTWTLCDEHGERSERILRAADGIQVETLAGESPFRSRDFLVEESPEGTRLTLEAILSRPVPPGGLSESVRKTLVFHLVAELLALGAE